MGYSAGGNLALTYALRSRLSSNNTNYINSSIPIRLVITEGAPTFSELFEENNVVQFGSEAYVQNNDIIDQFKYLFGINDITSLNDISEIQPQSYVSETNLNNISFMMFQGTGFTYYEETESQNFDGDSIVPVCDSTELISCLEEHIGNTPHEANETHIVYSSFFPCSHDNYIYAFINNAHIGGQGDNNYKTALENKLDDIL